MKPTPYCPAVDGNLYAFVLEQARRVRASREPQSRAAESTRRERIARMRDDARTLDLEAERADQGRHS